MSSSGQGPERLVGLLVVKSWDWNRGLGGLAGGVQGQSTEFRLSGPLRHSRCPPLNNRRGVPQVVLAMPMTHPCRATATTS